jgi:starch phosphorylase
MIQNDGLGFDEALQLIWPTTVFTTHTPVPAGNEIFDPKLVERYLRTYVESFGLSWNKFLRLGRVFDNEDEPFNMTSSALKLIAHCNGVSKLHGEVSRKMWHNIWPGLPTEEVPITSITNGVHIRSWMSHDMVDLLDTYFGPKFTKQPSRFEDWESIHKIPNEEFWRVHQRRRERLVFFARKRLAKQLQRRGAGLAEQKAAEEILDPRILTIGFARRFSTYKRAFLLFSDEDRLNKIINNPDYPVQILLAGKAHPLDNPGKEIIKKILKITTSDKFRRRIVFLEDYDINVARYLVQGVDIWLNNPRRPLEASGTSGMKAAANGAVNVSIMDGWWCEGYDPKLGFKIGNGEEYENAEYQDKIENRFLYEVLEREAIPLFYKRNSNNFPVEWIQLSKNSMISACRDFSAARMLREYTDRFYIPATDAGHKFRADNFKLGKDMAEWKSNLDKNWAKINFELVETTSDEISPKVGDVIPINLKVNLGDVNPDDVLVEVIAGNLNSLEQMHNYQPVVAILKKDSGLENGSHLYETEVICRESGRFGIAARVMPRNDNLIHNKIPQLIKWW